MEFIIWYFIIGVFSTAIHNVILISQLTPFQKAYYQFNIGAAILQVVVWPLLYFYWIGRILGKE